MTKKQYRTPNLSVGTVKKSIAAMASRWFLRNVVSQLWISRSTLYPPGDRSLRNIEAKHEQFSVDAGCTPSWIFGDHLENQLPNLFRYWSSSDGLSDFGNQFPVQAEAGPVPAGHRFGRDHKECLFSSEPEPTNDDPEELIEQI
jgi:hypothetical protein